MTKKVSLSPGIPAINCGFSKSVNANKQLREFLFGGVNVGKTTALLKLIGLLVKNQSYGAALQSLLSVKLNKSIRGSDLRIILHVVVGQKAYWVFVATLGDTKEDLSINVKFFNGILMAGHDYYIAYGSNVYKYNAKTNANLPASLPTLPDVCVGACRNSLASYYTNDNLVKIKGKHVGKIVWRELVSPCAQTGNGYGALNGQGRYIPVDDIIYQMYNEIMDWLK